MKRRLTPQEQVLIGLGALVVVLLLAYAALTGVMREDFRTARRNLGTAKENHNEARELRQEYEQWWADCRSSSTSIARLL